MRNIHNAQITHEAENDASELNQSAHLTDKRIKQTHTHTHTHTQEELFLSATLGQKYNNGREHNTIQYNKSTSRATNKCRTFECHQTGRRKEEGKEGDLQAIARTTQ